MKLQSDSDEVVIGNASPERSPPASRLENNDNANFISIVVKIAPNVSDLDEIVSVPLGVRGEDTSVSLAVSVR